MLDQATGTFFPNSGDENPLRDIGHVLALKEDQNGHIWVGTTQGLFQLNVEPKRTFSPETFREARLPMRHFFHNPNDTSSLSHNHVWCIETDREGQVWVGTGRGLNRFDPKTGTFVRAPLPAIPKAHLLTNVAVSALLNDHAGNLWAGTKKGLYRVSPDRKTLRDLGNERYLQTGITRIMEDAQHHVWVGSDGGGLFRWAPNSNVPIRFSNEPDDRPHLARSDGFRRRSGNRFHLYPCREFTSTIQEGRIDIPGFLNLECLGCSRKCSVACSTSPPRVQLFRTNPGRDTGANSG